MVLGFAALVLRGEEAELDYLFVLPEEIGRGHGGRLWRDAAETAHARGCRTLTLTADPYAEPFYRAIGMTRTGETASAVQSGRMLPRRSLALA